MTMSTISPDDVNIKKHFLDAFGHYETEMSAYWVVKLAQRKGGWNPFTQEEMDAIYGEAGFVNFNFNRLISNKLIIQSGDDENPTYHITGEFVLRLHPFVLSTDGAIPVYE